MTDLPRRRFLGLAAAATLSLPGLARATPASPPPRVIPARPKVVVIRFGGGARRLESIDHDHLNYAPHLLHELLPAGMVWENVVIEGVPSHSTGTMHITSGIYDTADEELLVDELFPEGPTIFELARKHLGLGSTEALYVNADSVFLEQLGWSDHPDYGFDLRPGLLSEFEMRAARATLELEEGDLSEQRTRMLERQLQKTFERHYRPHARPDPRLMEFWREHARQFGPNVTRGDEFAHDIASLALERLRPQLMLVNFQDIDFAHWGLRYFYKRGLNRTDDLTWRLWKQIQQDPYYRDDTYFIVVPDCGRSREPGRHCPFQHHDTGELGSDEIFIYVWGPGVPAGARVDRRTQQIDVAGTVGALLGLPNPGWDAEPLAELLG